MWTFFVADNGTWYWFYPQLPNGWHPCVADDSQSYEPPRPTRYQVCTAAGWRGDGEVQMSNLIYGEPCDTFEDARRAALELAMAQKDIR